MGTKGLIKGDGQTIVGPKQLFNKCKGVKKNQVSLIATFPCDPTHRFQKSADGLLAKGNGRFPDILFLLPAKKLLLGQLTKSMRERVREWQIADDIQIDGV